MQIIDLEGSQAYHWETVLLFVAEWDGHQRAKWNLSSYAQRCSSRTDWGSKQGRCVLHSGMHWWLLKLWFHTSTICEDFTYTKVRKMQVMQASPPLPSPIKHIFYMSSEGTNLLHEVHIQILLCRFFHKESHWHPVLWIPFLNIEWQWWQVFPVVNSTVLEQLIQVDAVVYGIGSLYTSICPSLVLYAGSLCFITYSW